MPDFSAAAQDRAWPTLVEMCQAQAVNQPDRRIYRFLENGADVSDYRTLADLDRRARSIAARLAKVAEPGDRALLGFTPGLDFADAFFGCLYAGLVAVPVTPVEGDRNDVKRSRLEAIAGSCEPRLFLSTAAAMERAERVIPEVPALARLVRVAVDEADAAEGDSWSAPSITPETTAYLQYSSGSTGAPKGVILSHANVLHNLGLILENGAEGLAAMLGNGSEEKEEEGEPPAAPPFVSWLPTFHDLGLISSVIEPVYVGYDVVSMPPMAFVQRPVSWLRAISDLGVAASAGPNFAFELCARRVTAEQRRTLDLSGWVIAMVGAEPVRADILNRFCEVFQPCGFRREALFPGYGLAESTLMVSGGPAGCGPVIERFDAEALARGNVVPASSGAPSRELVGCGRLQPSMTLVLVDQETGQPCGPSEAGEIYVAGPSIGAGYWNNPAETERTFRAAVPGYADMSFLRTGDLGFLHQDQLYITGRVKDVIILDGLNHYPHDIELTVSRSHPAIREGFTCAFSIDDGQRERLVVLAETVRSLHLDAGDGDPSAAREGSAGEGMTEAEVVAAVRRAVTAEHGVSVHDVRLLRIGSLSFTSSAKLQRRECRSRYLAGEFGTQ